MQDIFNETNDTAEIDHFVVTKLCSMRVKWKDYLQV